MKEILYHPDHARTVVNGGEAWPYKRIKKGTCQICQIKAPEYCLHLCAMATPLFVGLFLGVHHVAKVDAQVDDLGLITTSAEPFPSTRPNSQGPQLPPLTIQDCQTPSVVWLVLKVMNHCSGSVTLSSKKPPVTVSPSVRDAEALPAKRNRPYVNDLWKYGGHFSCLSNLKIAR